MRSLRSAAVSVGAALTLALVIAAGLIVQGPGGSTAAQGADPADEIESRIDELLGQMTLEQKLGQLQMLDADYPTGKLTEEQLEMVRNGTLGSTLNGRGAKNTNEAQRIAVEESPLGIPLLFGFDVVHGYRTVFPVPLGEAATWDVADAERSAAIAAREARAAGVAWTFAPMVDIARDPRWGRIVEGAGEDPFLGSAFATARVQGFQGSDLTQPDRVAATAKHFVGYGGAEGGRDYNTVDVSDQRLNEVYLPPFRAAVDAGVASIMTSFNELSGVPVTGNRDVLTGLLREQWGWDGAVVSDYTAVAELIPHGYAADEADAARLALTAGTDIEMVSRLYNRYGADLLAEGRITMDQIDEAVRRVLRLKFRLGLFDDPYVDESQEKDVLLNDEHVAEARRIAGRSMVLLRNEAGALPLPRNPGQVAVVGPLADSSEDMLGSWTGDGRPDDAITVLEGMRDAVGRRSVSYAEGCEAECRDTAGFATAVARVQEADRAIVVLGEPASWSGEAASRSELTLPGKQLQLLKQLDATGTPYSVVLMNGRPLELDWLARNSPAVLEAWYPGTEGGNAIADILLGKVNPGGKLPVGFPHSVGQVPLYYAHKNTGRPPDPDNKYTSKYLDAPVTPLYPFGYGLSYTDFELSGLEVTPSSIPADGTVTVRATVSNTGRRAGDEVVQLYIRDRVASVTRPVRELRGFERVTLARGESRELTFTLDRDELGFWNTEGEFVVEPGEFDVWVADSSEGGLHGTFTVGG